MESTDKLEDRRAYAKGYAAGLRNTRAMKQTELRREIAELNRKIFDLRYPAVAAPDTRACLQMLLPGGGLDAHLFWPRDANADNLELILDLVTSTMRHWISKRRSQEAYSKVPETDSNAMQNVALEPM